MAAAGPQRHWKTIPLVVLAASFAAWAGPANAQINGSLTQLPGSAACVENTIPNATTMCQSYGDGIDSPASAAVSPDGNHVYTASVYGDSVAAFRRNPGSGALTSLPGAAACVASPAAPYETDCTATAAGLDGAIHAVVSPDGRHVYVASIDASAVVIFTRDLVTGALSQRSGVNCVRDVDAAVTTGCSRTATGLSGARALVVSPDGKNVYVAGSGADAVTSFSRDVVTGQLTQLAGKGACVEDKLLAPDDSCTLTATGLDNPRGIAISPDGRHVYAGSLRSDAIVGFSRASNGALTPLAGAAACVEAIGAPSTTTCPVKAPGLDAARSIRFSADGKFAYVAANNSDAISAFSRNASTGKLTQLTGAGACIQDVTAPKNTGCPIVTNGLHGVDDITLSPDGRNAYAAAFDGDAVTAFTRNTSSGALTPLPTSALCIEDPRTAPKTSVCSRTGVGLNGPRTVSFSPDGEFVYVPSQTGGSVAAFTR